MLRSQASEYTKSLELVPRIPSWARGLPSKAKSHVIARPTRLGLILLAAGQSGIRIVLLLAAVMIWSSLAAAQGTTEFTLQTSPLSTDAVAPGGEASIQLTIGSVNGFAGSVALSCQVTSNQATTATPVCTLSPPSVTPPATATATITTTTQTTTVGYSITITGTGPTTTYTTPPLQLTVLAVTPQFTITVQSQLAPSSVVAGSGAQGVVTINPINGYHSPSNSSDASKSGVYLSCATITPLVTPAPVCSFNPPNPTVVSVPVTSNLTVSTFGPVITGAAIRPPNLYALWLLMPMLAFVLVGTAASGKGFRAAWGFLALVIVTGALLVLPACGHTSTTTSTPNGTTPANTYTFTIVGVDSDGVISSNTGTTGSAGPTVNLTVTAPKTH